MDSQVLWRYRPLPAEGKQANEMEQIIREGKLFAPAAKKFNDPFDLVPVIQSSDIPIADQVKRVKRMIACNKYPEYQARVALKRAEAGYMNSPEYKETVIRNFLAELSNLPVLCFYPDWSSTTMWANYADSGAGYAIALRFDERWDRRFYPLPVEYEKERPKIDFAEDVNQDTEARRRLMRRACLTKSSKWADEKEHRAIFFGQAEGFIKFDISALEEVCLGFNASQQALDRVIKLRKECGLDFRVSKIKLAEHTYELDKIDLD